ncbi:Anaphase-promoting complex subunit 23 [Actinomortierella ambigua]|uniref:Anaphase-promoting complex subunit 23 n=1 Tax=Actinomortierella ambigua TaxID=1343610 RepID=A0A9P6QIK8_9FUNG|nr:Anaphase-promoting complex subunit 23 [Actinomortierella ambigua]
MVINRELDKIDAELSQLYQTGAMDSFCKYLYAIVLAKRNRKQHAAAVLVESVQQYPYNWSAWLQLTNLPANFMREMFLLHVGMESFNGEEEFEARLDELYRTFPRSAYMKEQRAMALYHAREFPAAQEIFEELTKEHPHRLDNLDVFSNLLYVTDNRTKLSFLAHSCSHTDNFRPETCLVIGNYYAMRNDHEKAVVYFKRALRLDRGYAAAWTLLGHEYLEMKNTYAAIEAYRRAVDYNHRDYRAWNGLGQTYEVLKMHYYALGYYQRATALRPYDGRLWCAMAECYESLSQDLAAIKCYTRALLGADKEKVALRKLPKLYKKIGNTEAAAHYFRKSYEQRLEEDEDSEDASEACIFLAYYERAKGNWQRAHDYAAEAMNLSSGNHFGVPPTRHLESDVANPVAGSLDSARWGLPPDHAYSVEQENTGRASRGSGGNNFNRNRRSDPEKLDQAAPPEPDVDEDVKKARRKTMDPVPFQFHTPPNPDGSPGDCTAKQNTAIQISTQLGTMVSKLGGRYPALKDVAGDLAQAVRSMPAKDSKLEELVTRYRTVMYGLIGLDHYVPYMSTRAKVIIQPLLNITDSMETALKDLMGCLSGITYDNAPPPALFRVKKDADCKVLRGIYDKLYVRATEAASKTQSSRSHKMQIEAALAKLRFQSASAYLSDQGAPEAIERISIDDGEQSELDDDLALSMSLALAAGDAFQACQHGRALKAVEKEASASEIRQYEQDIYDRLGKYSRSRDPAGAQPYSGCEEDHQSLVEAVGSALETLASSPDQSQTAFRMADNILERFLEHIQGRIMAPSAQGNFHVELQQLDIAFAELLRTIDRVPNDNPYAAMRRFSSPLSRIEGGIFQLNVCLLNRVQSAPDVSTSRSSGADHTTLRCNSAAELYRGILQETLDELDRPVQDQDDTDTRRKAIELLRSRIVLLARTTNLWNDDAKGLVAEIDSVPAWRGAERSEALNLIGDDFVAQLKATLADDHNNNNNNGAAVVGAVEAIPLIRAGSVMLQACNNVQRKTSDADPFLEEVRDADQGSEDSNTSKGQVAHQEEHIPSEATRDGSGAKLAAVPRENNNSVDHINSVVDDDDDLEIAYEMHKPIKGAEDNGNRPIVKRATADAKTDDGSPITGVIEAIAKAAESAINATKEAVKDAQSGIAFVFGVAGWAADKEPSNPGCPNPTTSPTACPASYSTSTGGATTATQSTTHESSERPTTTVSTERETSTRASPTTSPASATGSVTPSGQPSASVSATASGQPSASVSATTSEQHSASASPATSSPSVTNSASTSAQPSASASPTKSASASEHPSASVSATTSERASPATSSPSVTNSASTSAQPSASASPTKSASASEHPSASVSATTSERSSASASPATSSTASEHPSASASPATVTTSATASEQPSTSASPVASPATTSGSATKSASESSASVSATASAHSSASASPATSPVTTSESTTTSGQPSTSASPTTSPSSSGQPSASPSSATRSTESEQPTTSTPSATSTAEATTSTPETSSSTTTTEAETTTTTEATTTTTTSASPLPSLGPLPKQSTCIREMLELGDSIMQFRQLAFHLETMNETAFTTLSWQVVALERVSQSLIQHGAKYARLYLNAIWTIFRTILTELEQSQADFVNPSEFNSTVRSLSAMVQSSLIAKQCFATVPARNREGNSASFARFERPSQQHEAVGHGSNQAQEAHHTEDDYFQDDVDENQTKVARLEQQVLEGDAKSDTLAQVRERLEAWKTLQDLSLDEEVEKKETCSILGPLVDEAAQSSQRLWKASLAELDQQIDEATSAEAMISSTTMQKRARTELTLKAIELFNKGLNRARSISDANDITWAAVDLSGLISQLTPVKETLSLTSANTAPVTAYKTLDAMARAMQACRRAEWSHATHN